MSDQERMAGIEAKPVLSVREKLMRGMFALRLEVDPSIANDLQRLVDDALAEAASRAEDSARLDWIEHEKAVVSPYNEPAAEGGNVWAVCSADEFSPTGFEVGAKTLREAIDAARVAARSSEEQPR